MDSTINFGIESIKAINVIIENLRTTPDLVQRIRSQSQQLHSLLGALQRKSPIHSLRDADVKDWLEYQRICNKTLQKIENVLEDYANWTTGRVPILGVAKFQLGPKQELSRLMEDLEKCVRFFVLFAEVVLSEAQVMRPTPRHNPQSSRPQEPVSSLDKFMQMQLLFEAAGL